MSGYDERLERAATTLAGYKRERGILRLVDEQFKVQLDPWQEEALLLFESPRDEDRRISLQACAGPGKSALLAWCGLWFVGTKGRPGAHPKGAVTSITGDNLRDNLMSEYAKWMGVSEYFRTQFTWTAGRIFANDHADDWFISARSWPKSANAEQQGATLSGLHSAFVMAQVDESGGVPTTILRAAEQALSTCEFGKILQAGNPISLEGMLHEAATRLRHMWRIIRITGDPDDPNAWVYGKRHANGKPLQWAKDQLATYGRDNPWVKAYVLGLFPPASINALLGLEEVEAAMARKLVPDLYEWAQKRIGVDVARFGDDRSVFFPRQGRLATTPRVFRHQNTTLLATALAMGQDNWQKAAGGDSPLCFVDDTGHWGHGVIDQMTTFGRHALPVIFSDPAIDPRFENRRAEMWMTMADWVKDGGALPNIPELVAELTTPTYLFSKGRFRLEEKDQIKKRLGRSPDLADALALTFAMPDMPEMSSRRAASQGGNRAGKAKIDRDE